jgi:glutamate 5-kinase
VDAGLLILLSDVDGYYDRDPREDAHAQRIERVDTVTDEMIAGAGRAGSKVGTGGMATKLKAVRIAAEGGCRVVLAHGREADVVTRIVAGETVGTLFVPRRTLKNRTRWLLHSSARGTIHVDEGALSAIRRHKSLLPTGVLSVDGSFDAGDVVMVNEEAKLITSFSSSELRAILGHHSSEFATLLDADGDRTVIARPEDMVFLDDGA